MIESFIIWYLIGFFGFCTVFYLMDKTLTVRDLLVAIPGGFFGPVVLIFGLLALSQSGWKFLDKRIL
jgi:TRAP-type mannitol/chloroaromatic compound transport system permease large subunit